MKTIFLMLYFSIFLSGCITATSTGEATPNDNENSAPIITGEPLAIAENDSYYSFLPTAADTDGDDLIFTVLNKPSWASFDTQTGELFGIPDETTEYENITISVSDGSLAASLNAFDIEVISQPGFRVQISWEKPSLNIDGSSLNNISAYKVMYGTSSDNKDNSVYFDSDTLVGTIENLSQGDYFFSMSTITNNTLESDESDTFYFHVSN
jgi:hypothetical protein